MDNRSIDGDGCSCAAGAAKAIRNRKLLFQRLVVVRTLDRSLSDGAHFSAQYLFMAGYQLASYKASSVDQDPD